MNHEQLSRVQIINLTLLLSLRDSVIRDPADACCTFEINLSLADRLGAMSVQQIMAFVANVGDVAVFRARPDLLALLDLPFPLARPLAAVHRAPRLDG